MSSQVGHLNELAVAFGALIGLLAQVKPHVHFEMVVTSKLLLTHPTVEWLLTSVSSFMVLQDMLVPKRTLTRLTGEHLFTPCHCLYCAAAFTSSEDDEHSGSFIFKIKCFSN
jgi:phage-related protein